MVSVWRYCRDSTVLQRITASVYGISPGVSKPRSERKRTTHLFVCMSILGIGSPNFVHFVMVLFKNEPKDRMDDIGTMRKKIKWKILGPCGKYHIGTRLGSAGLAPRAARALGRSVRFFSRKNVDFLFLPPQMHRRTKTITKITDAKPILDAAFCRLGAGRARTAKKDMKTYSK